MAQQFYQPQRRSSRGQSEQEQEPLVPSSSNVLSTQASQAAGKTLDSIDNVLAEPGLERGDFFNPHDSTDRATRKPAAASAASGAAQKAAQTAAKSVAPEVVAAVGVARQVKSVLWNTPGRKRASIVSGVALAIIVALVLGIAVILPDELISLMTDLENHFFASVEHDLDKESDKLVSKYIKERILQRLGSDCESSVDLDKCVAKSRPGGNDEPASEDPIEGEGGLFDKYDGSDLAKQFTEKGITFTSEGDRVFMNAKGLPGGKIDLTDFMKSDDANLFEDPRLVASGFADTLEAVKESLVVTNGSYLHNIFTKLISNRFGGNWCFSDCDPGNEEQDRANLTPADEQNAQEAVDDVNIEATATVESDAINCLANTECDPTQRTAGTENAADDPSAGTPTSAFEDTASEDLVNLPPFSIDGIKNLIQNFQALKAQGIDALADAVADVIGNVTGASVTGEMVQQVIEKFSPILWIQLAAQAVNFIGSAQTKISSFGYLLRETPDMGNFITDASASDETKSGFNHPQATMLGSLTDGLSADGSTAESSPNVREAIDPDHNTDLTNADVRSYDLKDHFALDDNSNAVTKLSGIAGKIPGFGWLNDLASLINKIVGIPLGVLNALVSRLFGLVGVNALLAKAVGPLLQLIVNYLFPMPNLANLSGEDRGTMLAIGTDAAGNQAAEAVGGKALTPVQAATLTNEQQNTDYEQFERQPFFARMFSADSPYSLVSQLSLDIPAGNFGTLMQTSLSGLLHDPFSRIFGGFSTILLTSRAFADEQPAPDPAGVTQYGIPDNDPVFSTDPEAYWQQHDCAQQAAQDYPEWNSPANTVLNPDTGQIEHITTNGCLLIQRTVSAVGALAGYGD